jgi:hypothetical protein
VLPKSNSEAWVVVPAEDADGLRAIGLDLLEGRGDEPVALKGSHVPLFFDPQGHLTGLAEALGRFETRKRPPAS